MTDYLLSAELSEIDRLLPREDEEPLEEDFASRKEFLYAKLDWKYGGKRLSAPASTSDISRIPASLRRADSRETLNGLYVWANGESGSGYFKPETSFLSIAGSLDWHEEIVSMTGEDEGYLPSYFERFWPIFFHPSGCSGIFLGESRGSILDESVFWFDLTEPKIELRRIADTLPTLLRCYRVCRTRGAYERGGCHVSDPDRYLPLELGIFREENALPVFPIARRKGLTVFPVESL